MRSAPSASGAELQTSLELLLRLVAQVEASRPTDPGIRETLATLRRQPNLTGLPRLLARVIAQLGEALEGLRHTRLREVSTATESAAIEMLDGLDRTLAIIDRMDAKAPAGGQHGECEALRSEINHLYGALQFQDIISQQLRGVAAVMADAEHRLEVVTRLIDHRAEPRSAPRPAEAAAFNAEASFRDVAARQAAADRVFE